MIIAPEFERRNGGPRFLVSAFATLLIACGCATLCQGEDRLPAARALLLAGKYEEAAQAYQALLGEETVAAAIGLARCHAARGERDKVRDVLAAALVQQPETGALHAEAARWALERGDRETAEHAAATALKLDQQQLAARFVQAELLRMAGKLDEASSAYKWFVDYYNRTDVSDPEALCWIGQASAQFARWNRLKDQFSFLVNELYPEALKADPTWWPAHYLAGRLYLEKYNQAEAARELKAALAINPNAAEVHAALAEIAVQSFDLGSAQQSAARALELNPVELAAELASGDILLANFQAAEAIPIFATATRQHPTSEAARGRLAAAYGVVDGVPAELQGTRLGGLIDEAVARNAHCGEFFASLAAALDQSRKFPAAARFFREAIARMPQLIEPYGQLGVVLMRLGEEPAAKEQLDQAFAIDPFNVRVNNMLKVLEVLDGYATLETEHFVIRFDRGQNEILARYAADYLEQEVYPELCQRFGFQPAEKSLFEIFSRARNTTGHGWFSARMVGLPFVHTVGACAGKIVALASPTEAQQKFNWARVLKHEFVHVLNLQQTDFSIPHWFTEALAVGSEGFARPQDWTELLAERVAQNRLFNLDTINLGFVRPQSGQDWQMAYCQADLYARYITATYGEDALAKMLAAYRDNLDTAGALEREFQVERADFERGYLDYVRQIAASAAPRAAQSEPLAELERLHVNHPQDAQITARLAAACLARRDYPRARELAESALADPQAGQQAAYVLARLRLLVGETRAALALLEKSLDRSAPDENLLNLLAGLKLKAEDYPAAAELYTLLVERDQSSARALRSLAKVYLAEGNDVKLATILTQLAALDPDDLPIRKKLAHLALAAGDLPAAVRWSREAMHIDVMDPDLHRLAAAAHERNGEFGPAADEFEVAVKLNSGETSLRLALAEASLKAERRKRAREVAAQVLESEPNNVRAKKIVESIEK